MEVEEAIRGVGGQKDEPVTIDLVRVLFNRRQCLHYSFTPGNHLIQCGACVLGAFRVGNATWIILEVEGLDGGLQVLYGGAPTFSNDECSFDNGFGVRQFVVWVFRTLETKQLARGCFDQEIVNRKKTLGRFATNFSRAGSPTSSSSLEC